MDGNGSTSPYLTLTNVAFGLCFIIIDAILSFALGLGIGTSLMVSAGRCVLQLTVMALLLDKVFATNNVWAVVGIIALLNFLGAIEAVFNKSKRRFNNMFPIVLFCMMGSTVPISILGSKFAMGQTPFWQPDQWVPMVGMILGNAISSIGIAMNYTQKEFADNRDKIETYLSLGASRYEACKPIAIEAVKLGILPVVNQMSVIGLISIPGMMTGAIIGGKSVEQAARLQMIIMFMISASSALTTLTTTILCLSILTDASHRVRLDRMTAAKPAFYRWRDDGASWVWNGVKGLVGKGLGKRGGGEVRLEGDE